MLEVDSGEISWKTPNSEAPTHSPNAAADDSQNIHGLFHRALDNLVDRALLPLSIVRFGFRQWITLSGLSTTTEADSQNSDPQTYHLGGPQPPTPTSPALDLPPDAEDFLAASAMLETSARGSLDQSAQKSAPTQTHTTYILRFTASVSTRAVLLQPRAQLVASLCPVTNSISDLKRAKYSQPLTEDTDQTWPAIAVAKIAPYGITADIVSVPETHLGNLEERTLDAWSKAFGYSHSFLTACGPNNGEPAEQSNLLWIRIRAAEEPLLYPRKLVLVDRDALPSDTLTPKSKDQLETADIDTGASLDANPDNNVVIDGQSYPDSSQARSDDASAAKVEVGLFGEEGEEAEEGEELSEEEGEFDEEGEIAGDLASVNPSGGNTITGTSTSRDPRPVASTELDAIVAELRTATSRSLEKSLATIQDSMAAFQAELRVEQEQEEARRREKLEKDRAAAAAAAAQSALDGSTKASHSRVAGGTGSRKRPRSNTRDEASSSSKARRKSVSAAGGSTKSMQAPAAPTDANALSQVATPDDSIPLAQTLLNGMAGSTPAADPAAAAAAPGTSADIDSLFGSAAMGAGVAALDGENGAAAEGDMGLGFGQLGDDLALGMGLGMGMGMGMGDNLDVGMGDFSTSMFGVTDDDFNFFDSVPPTAQQPKAEAGSTASAAAATQPLVANTHSLGLTGDHGHMFQTSIDLDTAVRPDPQPTNDLGASDAAGHPMQDNIDDMFDDGMFDSFFGGGSSTAAAPVAEIKSETEASAAETTSLVIKSEPAAGMGHGSSGSISGSAGSGLAIATSAVFDSATALSASSLSSPPGMPSSLLFAEAQAAGIAIDPTMAAVTGAELATPASIKMTPAPSIDLQSPAPAIQHMSAPTKVIDATAPATTGSPSSSSLQTNDTSTRGTVPSTNPASKTAAENPTVSAASGTLTKTSQRNAHPARPKAMASVRRIAADTTTPKPYSSVTTPYDDVGVGSRSWLQDSPTPSSNDHVTLVDPRHTPRDEIDARMQCAALIEKSLNPVSWIKRVSARRMQRSSALARKARGAAYKTSGDVSAVPSSVRRLKGWLASYRAKSSYARDFVPSFVLSAKVATSGSALMMQPENSGRSSSSSGIQTAEPNGDPCTVPMAHAASHDTVTPNSDAVGPLQYSTGAGAAAFVDESLPRAPSFTSIINPRRAAPSDSAQMPGMLAPSLRMADLQMVASATAAPASKKMVASTAKSNAIDGSWVPWWMQAAGGFAELVASAQNSQSDLLTWASGIECLVRVAKTGLDILDGSDHAFHAHIPLMFVVASQDAALHGVGNLRAENLGARIGGLLRLGHSERSHDSHQSLLQSDGLQAQPTMQKQGAATMHLDLLDDDDAQTRASSAAVSLWLAQIRQTDRWTGIVETMADWAVGSSLLSCVACTTHDDMQQPSSASAANDETSATHAVAKAVGAALTSFWRLRVASASDSTAGRADANMDVDFEQPSDKQQQSLLDASWMSESTDGLLTLTRLVSLENPARPSANKYRGFVVKKRRTLAPAAGGSSLTACSGSTSGNSSAGGSIVVPSGPGTIEPLLDVRIVVGTYGQQDVPLPGSNSGPAALRNRDSRSLYIKRWRYTQRLGSRATHEALVAAGEIEETEEGEEREDGEDGPPAEEEVKEPTEDWPDPDNSAMEAEDALRRVCLATSPVSLRWWTQMQMRPIGASKDIRWCAFVPPCISSTTETAVADDDDAAAVRDWCRVGSAVAEWYLGDVDSAYQASHLGTHRPLGLHKVLDGVFTQLTESGAAATLAGPSASLPSWSARLFHDAERLGSCMAHAWYTTSQLEQQQQQQSQSVPQSHMSPQPSQSQQHQQHNPRAADGSSLTAAKTLVMYLMVPYSKQLALWLAMAEASGVAMRAFESTLHSLITRTASGVPSSTTGISTSVPWPSLVVHPLPLDLLAEWHRGRRLDAVPSAQETALAVYNRSPEYLTPPPPLATALPAATVGTATTPHSTTIGRHTAHATPATSASAGAQSDFMAAALGRRPVPRGVSSRDGQLARHSGYFFHVADQRLPGGVQSFAHRAYVVSMPCSFPSSQDKPFYNGCCVPATMALARTTARSDIVSLDNDLVDAARLARDPASSAATAAFSAPRSSAYPSIAPKVAPKAAVAIADPNESSAALAPASRGDEDVAVELDEVRVEFDPWVLQHNSGASPRTSTAANNNNNHASIRSQSLCKELVSHPLRPSDQTSTLHCIYTVIGRHSTTPWVGVCWCDERGEYVEHQVFAEQPVDGSSNWVDEVSPVSAGRIWAGCTRYQRLFGGNLRVVLAEWHGLSLKQANSWRSYFWTWQQQQVDSIQLILVNLGINPNNGLSLFKQNSTHHTDIAARRSTSSAQMMASPPSPEPTTTTSFDHALSDPNTGAGAATSSDARPQNSTGFIHNESEEQPTNSRQFSLVLHSHQPMFKYTTSLLPDPEYLQYPSGHSQHWATGYLVLSSQCKATCLCVQLVILPNNIKDTTDDAYAAVNNIAAASVVDPMLHATKMELMTTRSVIKQYYQLAWLTHADSDVRALGRSTTFFAGSAHPAADSADNVLGWPMHLLPLPIAIVDNMRAAIEPLLIPQITK
ncbi:hypothetical protein IWW45_000069 [Coemansia sp. RSA 485]|nr:hypothetical protein IWW45_000069 [Coemansia sp. RSA 485]